MGGTEQHERQETYQRLVALSREIGGYHGRYIGSSAYDVLRKLCTSRTELGLPNNAIVGAFKMGLMLRGEKNNTIRPYVSTLRLALKALESKQITDDEVMRFEMNRLRAEISGGHRKAAATLFAEFEMNLFRLDPEVRVDILRKCLDLLK